MPADVYTEIQNRSDKLTQALACIDSQKIPYSGVDAYELLAAAVKHHPEGTQILPLVFVELDKNMLARSAKADNAIREYYAIVALSQSVAGSWKHTIAPELNEEKSPKGVAAEIASVILNAADVAILKTANAQTRKAVASEQVVL